MSSIDHFDLRSFDLNLLVAFDALMEERTVTRAAARLKVRQPAMSHSLATLRLLLQDALFVRVGNVMQPTARARALAPRVRTALRQMQDAIREDEAFDPGTQERTFRIGCSSELELLLAPDLTAHLQKLGPGLKLLTRIVDPEQATDLIDDGAIDLALGCYSYTASRHRGRLLFEQELACCFNRDLIDFETPISLEDYLGARHALVTLNNSLQGCLEDALERVGTTLNIVMAAADFLTILAAVAEAPMLATLPVRMARRYGPKFGLSLSPVPLAFQLRPVSMVWSAQSDRDPGAVWLRDQIAPLLARHDADLLPPREASLSAA